MLTTVDTTQGMDPSRTYQVAWTTRRCVHALTVLACAVVALLGAGAASARAEEYTTHRPEGIKEFELIADNEGGIIESEPEFTEPPGYYANTPGIGGGGDGIYETEEGKVKQNTEGYLPKGFIKLEHLVIESDYRKHLSLTYDRYAWKPEGELLGEKSRVELDRKFCLVGGPVNCATGNQVVTQTDLSVGGRGPALGLTRTYNSLLAFKEAAAGPFGFGWTGSYSAHLATEEFCRGEAECEQVANISEDNGSVVRFARSGEAWKAASALVEAKLVDEGSGYIYTLPNQTKLEFNSEGKLTKEIDRNGNAITLAYNAEKQLETATDSAGRN